VPAEEAYEAEEEVLPGTTRVRPTTTAPEEGEKVTITDNTVLLN